MSFVIWLRKSDGDGSDPVEVPMMGTVGDIRQAADLTSKYVRFTYQDKAIEESELLADLGIGPESTVDVFTCDVADDEILVVGAGTEEVNGIYKREEVPTNGGAFFRKKNMDGKEERGGFCIHWYFGPHVNGRKMHGWLLGKENYPIKTCYYVRACGERIEGSLGGQIEPDDEMRKNPRFFPPDDGWEAVEMKDGETKTDGVPPAPRLVGKDIVNGFASYVGYTLQGH